MEARVSVLITTLFLASIVLFSGCAKDDLRLTKPELTEVKIIQQNPKSLARSVLDFFQRPTEFLELLSSNIAILNGGLLIYAESLSYTESIFLADETSSGTLVLPNGAYRFYGIGYANSSTFSTTIGSITGAIKCASINSGTPILLNGGSKTIGVHFTDSSCLSANDFFGTPFKSDAAPPALKLHSCSSASTLPTNCVGACASCHPNSGDIVNYQIKLWNYKKTDAHLEFKSGGMQACLTAPANSGDQTTTLLQVPTGSSTSSPFVFEVGVFNTSNPTCSGTATRTYSFNNGLLASYNSLTETLGGDITFQSDGIAPVNAHLYLKGGCPLASTGITCDSGSLGTTCNISTPHAIAGGTTISGCGNLVIQNGGSITGPSLNTITINMNGSVTVENGGSIVANPVITATTVTIDVGGSINANGLGSAGGAVSAAGSGTAPGGGGGGCCAGRGAGHGGSGGGGTSAGIYGSITSPVTFGSGGGGSATDVGGAGGGTVKITTTASLTVNGNITANGVNGVSGVRGGGGGSGGSVWITADNLSGTGSVTANGGDGGVGGLNDGAGGGGGRISISSNTAFKGVVALNPGIRDFGATKGTLYYISSGTVLANSLCNTGTLDTTCNVTNTTYIPTGVTLTGAGNLVVQNGGSLVGTFANTTTLNLSGDLTIQNGGSILANMTVSVNNLTVDAGGLFNANELGELGGARAVSGSGTGFGSGSGCCAGRGGGYGGTGSGGDTGGIRYGSITSPTNYGSGGGGSINVSGGYGGGTIKVTATNAIINNGTISVDGGSGVATNLTGGGSGSGGSIWLIASSLTGSGSITAKGGNGAGTVVGGGGGGGRISLSANNAYKGTVAVTPGTTPDSGATSGSLYFTAPGVFDSNSLCDVGTVALTCTVTVPTYVPTTTMGGVGDLVIQTGGSILGTSLNTVTLNMGGDITIQNGATILANITATVTNFVVNATASLSANTLGYLGGRFAQTGDGAGGGSGSGCCGGAGAGYGGAGGAGGGAGGGTYGSGVAPTDYGSGGGGSQYRGGGDGAGAIKVTATGTITVSGPITANGTDGVSDANKGGGGGSGGSLWLIANTITGNGSIVANGGVGGASGVLQGSGGGGGRIKITATTNTFTGTETVNGGVGTNNGAAGTML